MRTLAALALLVAVDADSLPPFPFDGCHLYTLRVDQGQIEPGPLFGEVDDRKTTLRIDRDVKLHGPLGFYLCGHLWIWKP